MTIQEYYNIIKQKIENKEFSFKIKDKNSVPSKDECSKNSHLETIHYLMFEFMCDRKDNRKSKIFDYVCIPKGVNQGDFAKLETKDFLREIMKLKD